MFTGKTNFLFVWFQVWIQFVDHEPRHFQAEAANWILGCLQTTGETEQILGQLLNFLELDWSLVDKDPGVIFATSGQLSFNTRSDGGKHS